jgi:hypothetical protein
METVAFVALVAAGPADSAADSVAVVEVGVGKFSLLLCRQYSVTVAKDSTSTV